MNKKGYMQLPMMPGIPELPSIKEIGISQPSLPKASSSTLPSIIDSVFDTSGKLTGLKWNKNRPSWLAKVKRELGERAPDPKDLGVDQLLGPKPGTVAEGIDRRHIISNEMIKKRMVEDLKGKTPQEINEFLAGKDITKGKLDDKLSRYFKVEFNNPDNLWLGPAEENQNLGRMIGLLKNRVEAGSDKFEPFEIDMSKYGVPDYIWKIDSYDELRQAYYNANVDFSSYPDTTIGKQLEPSEELFQELYPKLAPVTPPKAATIPEIETLGKGKAKRSYEEAEQVGGGKRVRMGEDGSEDLVDALEIGLEDAGDVIMLG